MIHILYFSYKIKHILYFHIVTYYTHIFQFPKNLIFFNDTNNIIFQKNITNITYILTLLNGINKIK